MRYIKGNLNDETRYFKSKYQVGLFYGINQSTVFNMLEKGMKSLIHEKLKLEYIQENAEPTFILTKQPDPRIGRLKTTAEQKHEKALARAKIQYLRRKTARQEMKKETETITT